MKLDTESLNYIVEVAKTAKTLGTESLVIEPGRVRATDENIKRIVLHTTDVPSMPFGSLAITRIDTFLDRYELAKSTSGMYVEYATRGDNPAEGIKEDKDAMFIHSMQFKGKGLKLDFRPSNPLVVKAPRTLKDTMKYRLFITDELIHFITKGKSAFGTDEFTLVVTEEGAFVEMVDINNDKLSFQFADDVEKLDDEDQSRPTFSNTYPIAYILPLIKNNSGRTFSLSERLGCFEMVVNNLTSIILPKV